MRSIGESGMTLDIITIILVFFNIRFISAIYAHMEFKRQMQKDFDEDKDFTWVRKSKIKTEIFNPLHWNKWTAKQWIKYYKGE